MKKIGIVALVLLAGYGALVTYYDVAAGKERPKIVISLDELDLNLDSPVGEKLGDSLNLGQDQAETPSSQSNSPAAASLGESSESAVSNSGNASSKAQATKTKATFTGDLESLDLSKQGMEGALPKELQGQVMQASAQSDTSGLPSTDFETVDCSEKEKIKTYFEKIGSHKIREALFGRAIELRDAGKMDKLNQLIDDFKGKVAQVDQITPPKGFGMHHGLQVSLLEKYGDELEELKKASPGTPLEETFRKPEATSCILLIKLLQAGGEGIYETCGIKKCID